MRQSRISEFNNGWFVGSFNPAILESSHFEACLKRFNKGEVEVSHFQKTAIEVTLVISGSCRMGDVYLNEGDILLLEPGEVSDFEALEDSVILGLKTPSNPNDKVLTSEQKKGSR